MRAITKMPPSALAGHQIEKELERPRLAPQGVMVLLTVQDAIGSVPDVLVSCRQLIKATRHQAVKYSEKVKEGSHHCKFEHYLFLNDGVKAGQTLFPRAQERDKLGNTQQSAFYSIINTLASNSIAGRRLLLLYRTYLSYSSATWADTPCPGHLSIPERWGNRPVSRL